MSPKVARLKSIQTQLFTYDSFRSGFQRSQFASRHDAYIPREIRFHTLQWATAVAIKDQSSATNPSTSHGQNHANSPVFFLPKHCTLGTEAMVNRWPLSVSIGEECVVVGDGKESAANSHTATIRLNCGWCGFRLGRASLEKVRPENGLGLSHV